MNLSTPRRLFALLLCASVALALPACDSGGEDEDPEVEGQWSGTADIQGSALSVDVTFNESGGDISGDGIIEVVGESYSTDVSGTYSAPSVSLTFETEEFTDLNFSGDINDSGNRIDGELNGSGLAEEDLTLTRD